MSQTINGTRRRSRSRLFQFIVLAALLGLVGYSFSRFVMAPAQSSSVPQYVGSLKLVSLVEGADALAEINKLHGTAISLQSGIIAAYSGPYGGSHLMVWSAEAGSRAAAEDLIDRMVKAIARGGSSGFSNPTRTKASGRDIWQADGRGGQFYFYLSEKTGGRVVWLTIEGTDTASLLETALKSF